MKRIEQLLAVGRNRERFFLIADDIRREKLVIFFGAGLSLWKKYCRWGYPFEWTQKELENYYSEIKEYYLSFDKDESTEETLDLIMQKLEQGKKCGDFLKWGDILQEVILELKQLYDKSALAGDFIFSSFNDACAKAFQAEGDPPSFDKPYGIPAIYYLPYLSKLLITTNVDSSFEKVCRIIKDDRWDKRAIYPQDGRIMNRWNTPSRSILYIHGHIEEPDSLVMSKTAYDHMYPEQLPAYNGIHGAREVLKSVVEGYSILFIGASLRNDKTVRIINYESDIDVVRDNRKNNNLHLFPIAKLKSNGNLDLPPQIKGYTPLTYNQGMYSEISILLLDLIRETEKKQVDCTWQEPNLPVENGSISDETTKSITESLSNNTTFEIIKVAETDIEKPNAIVHYLFNHHSIAKHDSGLGWSICVIQKDGFALGGFRAENGEPFSPVHNYPIGDTLYVLAGNRFLNQEEEARIVQDIRQWHRDNVSQPSRETDPVGDGSMLPRIRLIILPPNEIDPQKIQVTIELFDQYIRKIEVQGTHLSNYEKAAIFMFCYTGIMNPTVQELFYLCQVNARENTRDNSAESTIDDTKEHPLTLIRRQ